MQKETRRHIATNGEASPSASNTALGPVRNAGRHYLTHTCRLVAADETMYRPLEPTVLLLQQRRQHEFSSGESFGKIMSPNLAPAAHWNRSPDQMGSTWPAS
jgi:hypothetical protein